MWFDYLGPSGETSVSAYVAKGGKIVTSAASGLKVRPFGENSTYPPLRSTGAPSGYRITVDTPEGVLAVDAHSEKIIEGFSGGWYTRWVGKLVGGFNGSMDLQGVGLFEQFAFR